jgi:hypothetical protein
MTFDGPETADLFNTLWLAFCVGRGFVLNVDQKQAGQSRDERRADLSLKRALVSVSDPAPKGTAPLPFWGDEARTVQVGATMVLDQAQIDKLTAHINRVPWPTDKLEAAENALDRLSAAPEVPAE